MLESFFKQFSDIADVPVDQIRYVLLLVSCYPLALVLRHGLHPSHTSPVTRHLFSFLIGLGLVIICFDWQVLLLLTTVLVSYIFLRTIPPQHVHKVTMVWVMACLSAAHLYRTLTDFGGYHLDFTTPLMVLVQKLSLVAFAVHDGKGGNREPLNDDQKQQKLVSIPSLLEYMSYCFNFPNVLAGPAVTMREYMAFIDGSNFRVAPDGSVISGPQGEDPGTKEPSSMYPSLSKLAIALISVFFYAAILSAYDNSVLLDPQYNILERIFYAYLFTCRVRCRYYFIWYLTDSICNVAGLGFEGYDSSNNAKWGLASNSEIVGMETATNMRTSINSWNVKTALWLRRVCYERVKWHPTLQTFVLSAWWHGFYPGYYLTFISFSITLEATRKMRRIFNPFITSQGPVFKMCYQVFTWAVTRVYVDYITVPFLLMWIPDVVTYWSFHYFIPTLSVIVVLLALPSGGSRRQKKEDPSTVPREDTISMNNVNSVKHD